MHTELPTRPAPPPDPATRDPARDDQARKLSSDAISLSDTILAEAARLLELDLAANADNQQHSPRAVPKPRILLTNLTRQLQREHSGAERYLAEYLTTPDPVERDLAFTRLSCLNITFYGTLWAVLKSQRGLVSALREIEVPSSRPVKKGAKRNMAKVDAMVENGAEWIKIITADARRLLYQMTSAGWDWEVEEGEPGIELDDEESGIEAIDAVRDLLSAAAGSRVGQYHYQTPRVRVMFPRITEGESAHIDALLRMIRTLGTPQNVSLSVECGAPDLPTNGATASDEELTNLLPRDDFFFSPTLNLDCTILFNMGSDTAHFLPDSFKSRTEARIKEDLEDERKNGPRLPRNIYPALGGRTLVCTDEVAENFRNTVLDIGTETEIARANLLLPPTDAPIPTTPPTEAERKETLKKFQDLSVHPVPADLRLPILIVPTPSPTEVDALISAGTLPPFLQRLDERIKSMNASAVVQGWAREQTTLTSNRQGMNLVNQIILEGGEEAGRAGNRLFVWMAPFGRRLAARPKGDASSSGESEANDGTGKSDVRGGTE